MERPRSKIQLAVVPRGSERLVGNCGLRRDSPGDPTGDLGFETAPSSWGRGYATEAAREMLAFGFRDLGLHRVVAHCIAENTASARVLEKIGMRLEGRLREHEWMRDRWWDVLLYGILEREWAQARG